MARARLVAAAVIAGVQSSWTAKDELQLLWQIQLGVYRDTADSADKTSGLSKEIRVLPGFEIRAERDGNSGQSPIWSTGVTMADAEVLRAVLLETLIPLIRVENALRSFPEEPNFATVDN